MSRDEFGGDGVEVERRGVDHARALRAERDDLARYQRTREQAHRATRDQVLSAHGDQVGRARAGADEMHGHGATSSDMAAAAVALRSAETVRGVDRGAAAPGTPGAGGLRA